MLTGKQYEQLAGTYRLGPGWYVTLTHENGVLWTQATRESKFPMTPLSENVFRIDAYGGRTMTFHQNSDGEIDGMTYANIECPKMEEVDLSKINYNGTYRSDELSTEYVISGTGDIFKMSHFRLGDLELTRANNHDFAGNQWFIQSVEFVPNKNGNVIGFYVTSGRARNQWFKKVK